MAVCRATAVSWHRGTWVAVTPVLVSGGVFTRAEISSRSQLQGEKRRKDPDMVFRLSEGVVPAGVVLMVAPAT